ncbi:MAG: ABC-F family ATP-binding cassette domain-containing protein [Phycisphaerae bacterium]|nr:ABC-F family ATP-binding cassette domain-containing protein [Phycisphaerae bacterium]
MASVVLQNVTRQFGSKVVLEGVALEIYSGQTLGLVGVNGAGKTTVFKLITGELQPDMGTVTRSKGLRIGHLEQEPRLDSTRTLYEEVGEAFAEILALEQKLHELARQISTHHDDPCLPELMAEYDRLHARFETGGGHNIEVRIAEVLGGLGFTEQDYRLPVSALSGGQKCRAALAKMLLQDRHLLLLDEPTNHLDIPAREVLEEALSDYDGTIIVVSHDRYFLDRVAQRLLVIERGRHRLFAGGYTTYIEALEAEKARAQAAASPTRPSAGKKKPLRPGAAACSSEPSPYDRMTIEQLEELIIEREARIDELNARFADQQVYRDPEASRHLQTELQQLRAELAEIEAQWDNRVENA